jgi:transposase-like protein
MSERQKTARERQEVVMVTKQRRNIFNLAEGITNRVAVGYARYSSIMQADGWTIQAQKSTLIDHFQSRNIPLLTIATDEAKSAKNMDRAGIQEAFGVAGHGYTSGH